MKIIKRLLVFLAVMVGLCILVGVLIAYVFEEDVKRLAFKKLNSYCDTPVQVDDVQLSLLSKFPNASLDFSNVLIRDAYRDSTVEKDTFFYADHIFLEFNIWDLFEEDYTVREVAVEQGTMHLVVNEDGSDNYHFWKTGDDSTKSAFSFALEHVVADELAIHYENKRNQQDYKFSQSQLLMAGDFTQSSFAMKVEGQSLVEHFRANGFEYASQQMADLQVELDMNTEEKHFDIKAGQLQVEELVFNLAGAVDVQEETTCDLTITGDQLDMVTLYSLLPDRFANKLRGYESKGQLKFESTVKGIVSGTHTPAVNADFSIRDGKLRQRSTDITLGKLKLEGNYAKAADQQIEYLEIKELSAVLGDGRVNADIKVSNFNNPKLELEVEGDLNLKDVQDFVQLDTIQHLSGRIAMNTQFTGKATALKRFNAEYFKRSKASGEVSFTNASVQFKGQPMAYESVSGTFVLRNNDAAIKALNGTIAGTNFQLDGFFRNFLNYIFLQDQKLTIEASLVASEIDLDRLLTIQPEGSTAATQESYRLSLPERVNCNLQASIGSLNFRRFKADNIKGIVRLKDKVLYFDPVRFENVGGTIEIDGEIDGRQPGMFVVSCKSKLRKLDVQQSFYQFENFGQTFIEDRHLKGKATADIQFACVLNERLEFDRDKIYSLIDVDIQDGELIEFETMQSMCQYMRGNKLIKAFVDVDALEKKLRHVEFSKLSNTIEIRNQTINIPKMLIASSAMDINIAGTHSFDDEIDYHFDFKLSEVLTKKRNNDEEFGPVADDGTGATLFITMKGTLDNYSFSYDRAGMKEKLRQDMQEEKQTFKSVLKTEFGLYSSDTSVGTIQGNGDPAPEFLIEWEEFEEAAPSPEETPDHKTRLEQLKEEEEQRDERKRRNNNSRFNKFLKKLEENTDEEASEGTGFVIEDQ